MLKGTTPFDDVPNTLLKKIAATAKRVSFDEGDPIYDVGDKANNIYVIITGRVQLVFGSSEKAKALVKPLLSGKIFGWAALYRAGPRNAVTRVASATCKEPTEAMAINTDELAKLFKSDKTAYAAMMKRVHAMVAREYSIPGTWSGFGG